MNENNFFYVVIQNVSTLSFFFSGKGSFLVKLITLYFPFNKFLYILMLIIDSVGDEDTFWRSVPVFHLLSLPVLLARDQYEKQKIFQKLIACTPLIASESFTALLFKALADLRRIFISCPSFLAKIHEMKFQLCKKKKRKKISTTLFLRNNKMFPGFFGAFV